MKKSVFTSIVALLLAGWSTITEGQMPKEYLGMPGDNLNLYAVMDLFRQSKTLEGFERGLNNMDSRINNLDLNGDNMVDYIMVSDYVDGNVHNIVLRVALDQRETQDVAVFTIQRFNNRSVQVQLVGDEALYGKNFIVEPIYADRYDYGYSKKAVRKAYRHAVLTSYSEVAGWPIIRSIYRPDYIVWHSEWDWGYWPTWWYGWTPWYWHYYYGYHYDRFDYYYSHYRTWNHFRYTGYNDFYYMNIRHHSPFMDEWMHEGRFNATYSRPEQRIEGERYYSTRIHSGDNNGTHNNPVIDNQSRRTAPDKRVIEQNPATERRNSEPVMVQRPESPKPSRESATTQRRVTTSPSSQPSRVQRTEPSRQTSHPESVYSRPATESRRTSNAGQVSSQGRSASERSSSNRESGKVYASRR